MPVLPFPDRMSETRRRRRCRPLPAASLAKAVLTLWLTPVFFWMALVESIEEEACDDPPEAPPSPGPG